MKLIKGWISFDLCTPFRHNIQIIRSNSFTQWPVHILCLKSTLCGYLVVKTVILDFVASFHHKPLTLWQLNQFEFCIPFHRIEKVKIYCFHTISSAHFVPAWTPGFVALYYEETSALACSYYLFQISHWKNDSCFSFDLTL